jgi:hypothetical protein
VFYLDEDYNASVNYFAGKEDSFSDYEAECHEERTGKYLLQME